MDLDSTRRFSSRVEDYIRYRPSYPEAVIALLEQDYGLNSGTRVADIGSGTGMLSQLLLRSGCEVFGVEPNADMRAAGERLLSANPRFHSLDGRAEATGLADHSVDLVTAAQAFHWFDIDRARLEFRRILRPPGNVVLLWNERLVSGAFLEEYEALLQRYAPDYAKVDHRRMDSAVMDSFYGQGSWTVHTFPNDQWFNLEGVLGRLHSSSYAPPPGTEAYERINRELTAAFAKHDEGGVVDFRYETKVYVGQLG